MSPQRAVTCCGAMRGPGDHPPVPGRSGVFSEVLTGQELWPWQAEVARHPARYRCLLVGRRAGKSRLLALLATWTAFRRPGASVVLICAEEPASLRVLADVTTLCRSPLSRGRSPMSSRRRCG